MLIFQNIIFLCIFIFLIKDFSRIQYEKNEAHVHFVLCTQCIRSAWPVCKF